MSARHLSIAAPPGTPPQMVTKQGTLHRCIWDRDEKLQAQFRDLWMQTPQLSCAAIAKAIGRGLTKNSIVGAARRLGLPPRENPIRPGTGQPPQPPRVGKKATLAPLPSLSAAPLPAPKKPGPTARRKAKEAALAAAVPEPAPEPPPCARPECPSRGMVITTIPLPPSPPPARPASLDRGCCWPIGSPGSPGFRMCDAPITSSERKRVYCDEHHAVAFVKTADRDAATLDEVQAYATRERVVVKPGSGLHGLMVAVNAHRRARGLPGYMITRSVGFHG